MKTWLAFLILLLTAGCESNTLETGYAPRKLTDSPSARQAYYAAPFSPEAGDAGHGSGSDGGLRSPSRY